jgi:hypothetical protein
MPSRVDVKGLFQIFLKIVACGCSEVLKNWVRRGKLGLKEWRIRPAGGGAESDISNFCIRTRAEVSLPCCVMLRLEWLRHKGAEKEEGFEADPYEIIFSVAGERIGKRFNWKGQAMCGRMLSSVLMVGLIARVLCAAGPSASELLKRFGETQDKLTASFISKAESIATWTGREPLRPEI